jgi:thiamine pyrophosphokinase
MSSHHIVREKQEPALLVLGLNNFSDEQLGQLLEWSPTVITSQQTAEKLNSYGIKLDWIITNDENEVLQSDVKLISTGENTLIDAALKYLIELNYPAVNIISDELNLKDYEVFANKINLVIFNNGKKIYPVTSGFNKWKPSGEIIEILSQSGKIDFTGLGKIKNQLYKTTHDGFFSLHFNEPFLFIGEEL